MEETKLSDKTKTAKEIADAEKDICKIEFVLNDSQFNSNSIKLYNELDKKDDYKPYIILLKARRGMAGNQSFGSLPYLQKRNVLMMIKDAIELYIAKKVKAMGEPDKKSKI